MISRQAIRLGTRGSRLALTQTHWVAERLRAAHPHLLIEVVVVQTTGDKILDSPLSRIGGKGVFTKEIEEALLDGRIDVAVHSLKDLPTVQPEGLALAAVPERGDPRDILIAREPLSIRDLPPSARMGTSSLRRQAQIRLQNGTVRVDDLRGNVPTRISKVVDRQYDAIILAAAGVARLELTPPWSQLLDPAEFLPAPGQGALGLQIRSADREVHETLQPLHHEPTMACCGAERSLLQALGGGCQLPLGTFATFENNQLFLRGLVVSLDGTQAASGSQRGPISQWREIGNQLAQALLQQGAAQVLASLRLGDAATGFAAAVRRAESLDVRPLGGRQVLITRDEDTDGPLSQALREAGAHPVCLPLIRHESASLGAGFWSHLKGYQGNDWMVVTSQRALRSLMDSLQGDEDLLPPRCRVAAVGEATAAAARDAGWSVDLVAPDGTARSLAGVLSEHVEGRRVCYPRSDAARPDLAEALRGAGADVWDPVIYHTRRVPSAQALQEAFRTRPPDAVLFCSPSAVEALMEALGPEEAAAFLGRCVVGSMGPSTSEPLKALGLEVIEPAERSFEGLVAALERHWTTSR